MISGSQASTILEAAALGVPTVILQNVDYAAEVSIPSATPAALYYVCSTIDQAEQAIEACLGKTDARDIEGYLSLAGEFREACFSPVNASSIRQMLAA